MTSESSLICLRSRARNEANLKVTRPCFGNLQVFGVVGRADEQIDQVATRADRETESQQISARGPLEEREQGR